MSEKRRSYIFESEEYIFDFKAFQDLLLQYKRCKGITSKMELYKDIADRTKVGESTIRSWIRGVNAPNKLEDIKKIAEVLGVKNWGLLVKKTMNNRLICKDITQSITDRQRESLKKIYNYILEFLDDFVETKGFCDCWKIVTKPEYQDILMNKTLKGKDVVRLCKTELYDYGETKIDKLTKLIHREYLDLYRIDTIYKDLLEYVEYDLFDTFNGKFSYEYRYGHFKLSDDQIFISSAEEDSLKALKKLNEMLEPYF